MKEKKTAASNDLFRDLSGEHSSSSESKLHILLVSGNGLARLSRRPPFLSYVVEMWRRRFFILEDAKAKAFRSTRDYRLWRFWLVLNPLFDVILYGFLFGFLFRTSRGVDNFIGFLFLGIIYMKMISGLLNGGSGLISNNRALIRAFSFPRVVIPLSQTLRALLDNLLPAVVAVVVAFLLQWGKPPSLTLFLIIPLYLMLHIFGSGLMMILARLTAEIPDVKALVGLVTQAWFFLSGVMFSVERFSDMPYIYSFMTLNPAHLFLAAIRESTIYGTCPSQDEWLQLVLWTFGTFALGFVYFWMAEEKYTRLV